jgi:hypothetical protein
MATAAVQVLEPYSGLARVPFLRECRLEQHGHDRPARMFNLSALGTYLVGDPIPGVGECFRLSFCLPDAESLTVDAVVMWQNDGPLTPGLPPGCGLRFLALAARDLDRLHTFVKAYTTHLSYS